jgi:hypothetical protein
MYPQDSHAVLCSFLNNDAGVPALRPRTLPLPRQGDTSQSAAITILKRRREEDHLLLSTMYVQPSLIFACSSNNIMPGDEAMAAAEQ